MPTQRLPVNGALFLTATLPPPPGARRAAALPVSLAVHGVAIAVAAALAPIVAREDGRQGPPTTLVFDVVRTARPEPVARPLTPTRPPRISELARPVVRAVEPEPVTSNNAPAVLTSEALEGTDTQTDVAVCLTGNCAEGTGIGAPSSHAAAAHGAGDGGDGPPPRVGGDIREPRRTRYVAPAYPPLAITARVGGTVVLDCVIDRDGAVADVRVLTGHPLLAPAAVEAVRRWRYTPTLLNDTPVAVTMTVTVRFVPRY